TFHDLGVSAYRGDNVEIGRLGAFLQAVREGIVPQGSYLLVESLDRLSRQSARRALRILEDLCDEGVVVVTLADGRAYTREALDQDPTALLMSILIFMRAHEESQMKARRLKAAWTGKRQMLAERPLTSVGPGWLVLKGGQFRVVPERARIVKRIFREV